MNKAEYTSLVNTANLHSHLYYVANTPVISDAEFDTMLLQLQEYETANPADILADSPTQRVGSDLSANGRALVAHRTPMLSQQKAHTFAELATWRDASREKVDDGTLNFTFSVECSWKYDGISCSLVYVDGKLVSAATRGDGAKGQDLMQHVALMPSVPSNLEGFRGRFEVRGEIVCPRGLHTSLGYSDERTAAAAICNASYSDAAKSLVFYPWEVIANYGASYNPTVLEIHKFGFMQVEAWRMSRIDEQFIQAREIERKTLDFPVDGLVFRVVSNKQFKALGANKHHPHGSIAYKFAAVSATTTVTSIEVRVVKSGRRTPVAHIAPVVLMGKTITKVNLYSERTMESLGVKEGCTAVVALQNDVTPKIVSVEGFEPTPANTTPAAEEGHTSYFPYIPDDLFCQDEEEEEQPAAEAQENARPLACAMAALGVLALTALCVCGAAALLLAVPVMAGTCVARFA